jgi:chemotaxis protein CheX
MTVSTVSLRELATRVADQEHFDASVDASVLEVFETMLDWRCRREPVLTQTVGSPASESVTAVVGFGGLLSGACIFRVSTASALRMAARLTGAEFAEVDATVQDAIGEICNMLAGSWKGRIPELGVHCGLSVPAVIAGCDYKLRIHSPKFELHHAYSAGDVGFEVTIVCDGLK